jgi:hypothetical protein
LTTPKPTRQQFQSWEINQSQRNVETVAGITFDATTPLPMEPSLNAEDLQMLDALQNLPVVNLFPVTPGTKEEVLNARPSIETIAEVNPSAPGYREMTSGPVEFDTPESTNITFQRRDKRGLPWSHRKSPKENMVSNLVAIYFINIFVSFVMDQMQH